MHYSSAKVRADGSLLGYLYQIDRAIVWLSSLGLDAIVGVEVDDDILVQLKNTDSIDTIYEQSKHTITKNKPYSDKGEDLWKTLFNWLNLTKVPGFRFNNCVFSVFSNKSIPKTRFIWKINGISDSTNLDDIQEVLFKFKELASNLPSSLEKYGKALLECNDDFIISFFKRIQILDDNYSHERHELKKQIRTNLSVSDNVPFSKLYNSLFGFVLESLIECWLRREDGIVSVKSFNNQYNLILKELLEKPFFESAIESLPVTEDDVSENKKRNFVKQLLEIECEEEEVMEAISDFVRCQSERSRWAKAGEISKEKIQLYFEDIQQNWKTLSRPAFKFAKQDELSKVGYQLYYETLKYKGKLLGFEPIQSYTSKGACHFLADELRIGWHPLWIEKFGKK